MSAPTALTDLLRPHLTPLLAAYAFNPYRHYRTYSRTDQRAILAAEVDVAVAAPGGFSRVIGGAEPRVAVIARPLAWDTGFFGVSMARIDYVLASPTAAHGDRVAAIDAVCAAARAAGVQHLTARVDVADLDTMGALEQCGFRTMDALVTYIMRPVKDPPNDVRTVGTIRKSREDDAEAILEITREAYRGYRGRFHLDPHLPAARADEFYVEWARQCLSGTMADALLVWEDSTGRVNGFMGFRRREPVSSLATPVYGGGLGACRRDSPGGYVSLIGEGTRWAHARGAVAEVQTQNYNFAVIRTYEAAGAHYVRAEYTLHAWLG